MNQNQNQKQKQYCTVDIEYTRVTIPQRETVTLRDVVVDAAELKDPRELVRRIEAVPGQKLRAPHTELEGRYDIERAQVVRVTETVVPPVDVQDQVRIVELKNQLAQAEGAEFRLRAYPSSTDAEIRSRFCEEGDLFLDEQAVQLLRQKGFTVTEKPSGCMDGGYTWWPASLLITR